MWDEHVTLRKLNERLDSVNAYYHYDLGGPSIPLQKVLKVDFDYPHSVLHVHIGRMWQ